MREEISKAERYKRRYHWTLLFALLCFIEWSITNLILLGTARSVEAISANSAQTAKEWSEIKEKNELLAEQLEKDASIIADLEEQLGK